MDPGQLREFEQMCLAFYQGTNQSKREEAQKTIFSLSQSVDFIPQAQSVLDNSTQAYAQLVACSSLEALITQFWNNFSTEQKVEIRNYILNYLGSKGDSLQEFVVNQLCKLISRITKLGWLDCQQHRDIVTETSKFLKVGPMHYLIGLKILLSVVDEMNNLSAGKTFTAHRKVAVSFRDQGLFPVFQIAITTLKNIQNRSLPLNDPQISRAVTLAALSLFNKCFNYDFIGTNADDSTEDLSTLQVPSTWRPIIQEASTIPLLFDFYTNSAPPASKEALEALVQLSSVRRSIFTTDTERSAFLTAIMSGIFRIMSTKVGLQNDENYHEFCRLLGRLKSNYQLSELIRVPNFLEWLEQACEFTLDSFKHFRDHVNSVHYLLALWGRLVSAFPYLRPENSNDTHQRPAFILKQCVLRVTNAYIESMMKCATEVAEDDGEDNPMDDETSLKEQMERFPQIAHMQYETVARYLSSLFKDALGYYDQPLAKKQTLIVEGKLAWLTQMIAAVIGSTSQTEAKKSEDLTLDSILCKQVFQLVQVVGYRQTNSNGQFKCDSNLEKAMIQFFRSFRKAYFNDGLTTGSLTMSPISSGNVSSHPLLAYALQSNKETTASETLTIFSAMAIGDTSFVMNLIINKLCSNIRYLNQSKDTVLDETLELFIELITSYSSSKTLLNLETVQFIIRNHTGSYFPFLGYDSDNKNRIKFYAALMRLVFTSSEDMNNAFDLFIAPNLEILNTLLQTEDLKPHVVKVAIVGILRDMRGITEATYSKRTYTLLFEALYPNIFHLLLRVAEQLSLETNVAIALLKFLQEFVQNKSQRITFDQSSANGILLFRETSKVLCAYGRRILQAPVVVDVYVEKYKGVRLLLNTLSYALSGNYVNFGVFALYNDQALESAMDVALQICLNIPIGDIMTYVKLSKAFFGFVEILFKNHLDLLCQLGTSVFLQLLVTNLEGLQSQDLLVCGLCASTIDHLCTYIFLNRNRDKPTMRLIAQHINSDPELLNSTMTSLMNVLLLSTHSNNWAITRPILSLLLASEQSFTSYKMQLIATQSPENQQNLSNEFDKLMEDLQQSLETANRDRFTQKLTVFRTSVREFLTF